VEDTEEVVEEAIIAELGKKKSEQSPPTSVFKQRNSVSLGGYYLSVNTRIYHITLLAYLLLTKAEYIIF
jgi:hypothetical protein